MFRELISIFTGAHPLKQASNDFLKMLGLVEPMITKAGAAYWGQDLTPEERTELYKQDVQVNKLERSIRKNIITHLAGGQGADVPYSLLIMSLVKDVERIGDYAKNLMEVCDLASGPFPDSPEVAELTELSATVHAMAREAKQVFETNNADRATELIREGRSTAKRCDELIRRVAHSDATAPVAVALTLGGRFYKRISGHYLNLLSGIVMPVHKLDYFDEDALKPGVT